jgi:hypothetical protein
MKRLKNKVRNHVILLKSKIKWFTLVELIISITLLVILWTIWIISYSSHLSWVRDTNRITELDNLSKLLNAYRVTKKLPDTENWVIVYWSWSVKLWTQWYAWKIVLAKLGYVDWWIDPLDRKYYTYYVTASNKYYQLLWFLEEKNDSFSVSSIFNNTYASWEYKKRFPVVFWDKLWVLLNLNNDPIQEIQSIITWSWINISTTTWSYTSILTNNTTVSWDNTVLNQVAKLVPTGGEWCYNQSWSLVCDWWVVIHTILPPSVCKFGIGVFWECKF